MKAGDRVDVAGAKGVIVWMSIAGNEFTVTFDAPHPIYGEYALFTVLEVEDFPVVLGDENDNG